MLKFGNFGSSFSEKHTPINNTFLNVLVELSLTDLNCTCTWNTPCSKKSRPVFWNFKKFTFQRLFFHEITLWIDWEPKCKSYQYIRTEQYTLFCTKSWSLAHNSYMNEISFSAWKSMKFFSPRTWVDTSIAPRSVN